MKVREYFQMLAHVATTMIDYENEIEEIAEILTEAKHKGGRVFIIGNGGSAATADHFSCDLMKAAHIPVINLNGLATITAYANDNGYQSIYTAQLKKLCYPKDVLIAISTSGNSPNIIDAVKYCDRQLMTIISLTAFNGGELVTISDTPIHVGTDIIEIAEDIHAAVLHCVVRLIKERMR